MEETIVGREIECAVLGGYEPIASDVGEVLSAEDFYTFDAKYNNQESKTDLHPTFPEGKMEEVRTAAIKIFKALDGFGCSRVDFFMENGFNYFDTAHGYLGGKSETALRRCLTSRYPRESYILTNKLSSHFISKAEDIRPLFQQQLEACGVDYFDFYLMHAQDKNSFQKYKQIRAYETSLELLAEGSVVW